MSKKILLFAVAATVALLAFSACSNNQQTNTSSTSSASTAESIKTDYSNADNWFKNDYQNARKTDTQADVFVFNGTSVTVPDQENGVGYICDEMKKTFQGLYDGGISAFDDGTRMYSPYYRQIATEAALDGTNHNALIDKMKSSEVMDDIYNSLDYYFKNYNNGRPFILVGQSQGAAAVQIALEKYFGEEEHKPYLKNMVAAYSIAYGVDKNWLAKNDYLKFATGYNDTGVIVSWVTEGAGEKGTDVLLADNPSDTLVINPINWKTDETYAKAEECLGSLVDGEVVKPGIYNLQIDLKRGALICDNNTNYVQTVNSSGEVIWGGKSLHLYETSQVYLSIRQNMHDRIDAFLKG